MDIVRWIVDFVEIIGVALIGFLVGVAWQQVKIETIKGQFRTKGIDFDEFMDS